METMPIVSATILSGDPLVIFSGSSGDAPESSCSMLGPALDDRRVIFLVLTIWSAESDLYADRLAAFIKAHEKRHKRHRCIAFCNTPAEVKNLGKRGIKAVFGQQNAFVDPRLFRPLESDKDLYAVYTAQLAPFKRHELCAELPSVGLLYHNYGPGTLGIYTSLKQALPNARFMNAELTDPPHGDLLQPRVNEVLNRARVGLCLSAEEGGMHASVEYLLAGLPIVSTASKGGRDFFFHPDFVEIAEPSAASVRQAAERVLARAPPAAEIRRRTIATQQRQIANFLDFMDKLVGSEGGSGYGPAQWDAAYGDKLLGWEPLDRFLEKVPPAARDAAPPRDLGTRLRRFFGRGAA